MAIVTPTQSFPVQGNSDFMVIAWEGMANGDTGEPFILSQFADRSIQVNGTFGASGAVTIQGTNDSSNYVVLNDMQGNAILVTSPKIEAVSEIVVAIRPAVTAGDGTTAINVYMLVRKN